MPQTKLEQELLKRQVFDKRINNNAPEQTRDLQHARIDRPGAPKNSFDRTQTGKPYEERKDINLPREYKSGEEVRKDMLRVETDRRHGMGPYQHRYRFLATDEARSRMPNIVHGEKRPDTNLPVEKKKK
jgi:hypothetical protein